MEAVQINFDDHALFDELCHGETSLSEGGDLKMVTKDHGTLAGRPVVLLAFTVQLPDGSLRTAQVVLTGRNFAMMAAAFRGRYGSEGDSVKTSDKVN